MVGWPRFHEPLALLEVLGWPISLEPLASLEVIGWPIFLEPLASLEVIGLQRFLKPLASQKVDKERKTGVKSFILTYYLNTFDTIQTLTSYSDFWPSMTLNDLETKFFENLSSRAPSWPVISLLSNKFVIWPFWPFFVILAFSDLDWPLKYFFWKFYVKSFILTYNFPTFFLSENLCLSVSCLI